MRAASLLPVPRMGDTEWRRQMNELPGTELDELYRLLLIQAGDLIAKAQAILELYR